MCMCIYLRVLTCAHEISFTACFKCILLLSQSRKGFEFKRNVAIKATGSIASHTHRDGIITHAALHDLGAICQVCC